MDKNFRSYTLEAMGAAHNKHNGNGHDPDEQPDDDNVVRIPTLAERDRMRREKEKELRRSLPREPFFNLPPVTQFMVAAIIVPYAFMALALEGHVVFSVREAFGFKPSWYTRDFPGWPAFAGPFTYAFLHGSWLHVGMNSVMMLAFGAGAEKWMGGKRLLVLFFACSLAAAAFQLLVTPFETSSVIGASGGLSGLFAAVLIMLQAQGRLGTGRWGIWPFALFWIGLSFVFGLLGSPDGSAVAWAAHIGGFLAGLVLIKPVLRMKL